MKKVLKVTTAPSVATELRDCVTSKIMFRSTLRGWSIHATFAKERLSRPLHFESIRGDVLFENLTEYIC